MDKRAARLLRAKKGRTFIDGLSGSLSNDSREEALHDRIEAELRIIFEEIHTASFSIAQIAALTDLSVYLHGLVDPASGRRPTVFGRLSKKLGSISAGGWISIIIACVVAAPATVLGYVQLYGLALALITTEAVSESEETPDEISESEFPGGENDDRLRPSRAG